LPELSVVGVAVSPVAVGVEWVRLIVWLGTPEVLVALTEVKRAAAVDHSPRPDHALAAHLVAPAGLGRASVGVCQPPWTGVDVDAQRHDLVWRVV
jgi:hypothetical protein